MARKKARPWTIEESGIHLRVYPNGARWWADVRVGGKRTRTSLHTTEKSTAETNARAMAREIAKQRLIGVQPETLTLGHLFAAYEEYKGRTLSGQWKRGAEARTKLFAAAWGSDMPVVAISQSTVDAYCAARRAGRVAPFKPTTKPDAEPRMTNGRKVRSVRDGALDADFRWLSSVFNWAIRHKLADGRRLLTHNPLHDCEWPKEKNVRRPIASPERYTRTLEHADAVDPQGRIRCILALARHTGRRVSAIVKLRASDMLLTTDRIRVALAAASMDAGLADHMPHGAVRWSAETDKQGILHITPISAPMRAEVDRFLSASPRLGDVPLFPAPNHAEKPMRRDVAARWLLKAERLAELPRLVGGVWHPYRRLWATERKQYSDIDVAAAGGWKDVKALKLSYQQTDPASVLRVVQNGVA